MLTDRALPVLLGENTSERSRRVAGAVIGLSLGLLYGATSGWINSVLLWGIPLRVDLAKITLDIISAGAGGMVAGYIAAWSQSSFKSVVAGAAAIALFGAAKALVAQAGGAQFFALIIILVTIFLPSVALSLPITLVIRLAVNWREDALSYAGRARASRLARLYAGLAAVGLLTGMFAQMTPGEQAAIRQVNAMIQNGLAAGSEADVPPSLQAIDGFTARARGRYTLSPSVDVSQDQSIAGSSAVETVTVDVLFEEGLHFECMVGATLARPLCAEK